VTSVSARDFPIYSVYSTHTHTHTHTHARAHTHTHFLSLSPTHTLLLSPTYDFMHSDPPTHSFTHPCTHAFHAFILTHTQVAYNIMDPNQKMALLVEILNKYLYFFEHNCESVHTGNMFFFSPLFHSLVRFVVVWFGC
jgi:hypothetical protein